MLLIHIVQLYLMSVTVASVIWAVHIRTLNGSNFTRMIFLLSLAVCFYILGYTMELNSYNPAQIEFWNYIEYIGIPFISALWLTSALMYTGCFIRYKKILLLAIYVIPLITVVLRFTNNYHHLYFSSVSYMEEYGRLFLLKKAGPWMYVQLFHSMFMVLAAMGLFVVDSFKSAEKYRGKILLTVSASVFAVAGLILSQVKPFGFTIDHMALCLPVACFLIILAISWYDLLETGAIARSKVFQAGSDAILLLNQQNKVLDYNSSAEQLFKQINIHLDNGYITSLFHQVPDLLESFEKTETSVVKLFIHEEARYFDVITQNIDDRSASRGLIKIIREVTEVYRLNEELKRQVLTDELSTLNNRRAFMQTGKEWIVKSDETGSSLYLLMLDLDFFKNVNDQYGHPAGDQVIRDFSQILKAGFDAGSLIARLGGEEFGVLYAGFDDEKMMQTISALLKKAEQHTYRYRNDQFHVTVSMGATKKQSGQTLESMMSKADKALYQSKNRGRNCVTFL